jgi:hypothetical protein
MELVRAPTAGEIDSPAVRDAARPKNGGANSAVPTAIVVTCGGVLSTAGAGVYQSNRALGKPEGDSASLTPSPRARVRRTALL